MMNLKHGIIFFLMRRRSHPVIWSFRVVTAYSLIFIFGAPLQALDQRYIVALQEDLSQ